MAKLNDEELRALRTLARSPSGCAELVLMAHGFELDQVANLVFRGLANREVVDQTVGARSVKVVRGRYRGRDGGIGEDLHLTGVTSSGVPFLALIQPAAVRRHGHCSVYGPPRPSVTCNAMSSSSRAVSIGFQP
jgi:hypothetical protein